LIAQLVDFGSQEVHLNHVLLDLAPGVKLQYRLYQPLPDRLRHQVVIRTDNKLHVAPSVRILVFNASDALAD
jgi:hypothetical protein